jgi:integration host factor subunit alpha
MIRIDLIKIVSEKMGFPWKESTEIVDWVFEIMKETLERGENIKISGFGNFVVRQKRARRGRNPRTGEAIVLSERKVLTFKTSAVLRKLLNQGIQS